MSQRKNGREWTARADLAGVKTGTENRPVARFCGGSYASISAPLNTHSCDVKRSQDDHELFESSVDDPSCLD
ncbi:hypothetical protein B6D87_00400 [Pseudomonas fragi]|nr:hypothetical protein B6D87_00400 [Pseudomonas fragi]